MKQGGTRRGANMGILRVDHPDIMEFITCKEDLTQVTNFNISVAVTDAFMRAVEERTTYDLIDPRSGAVTGQLDANTVWDRMIMGAWRTGEPGCFFIDAANRLNPVPHLFSYEATNPCGEQPLGPYDVCNLGSINVGSYVRDGQLDWDAFRRDIHLSTHFLDNIIDANQYPLPAIDVLSKRIRRIGLGIMGFADALVRLGVPYDSAGGGRAGSQGDGVPGRRREAGERAPGAGAGRVPGVGAVDLGAGRDVRARCGGEADSADAALAELQRDDDRADGDDLDHRGLLVGVGADFRRRVPAQSGGRDHARRERGFRCRREGGGDGIRRR